MQPWIVLCPCIIKEEELSDWADESVNSQDEIFELESRNHDHSPERPKRVEALPSESYMTSSVVPETHDIDVVSSYSPGNSPRTSVVEMANFPEDDEIP